MKNYPDKFTPEEKIEIDTLLSHCLDGLSDDSEKFLSTLFIRSLKSYIGETSVNEHIYLKNYEIPQIQLFDILIRKFPFVNMGHEVTNAAIINLLKNKTEATILDIGIGQGTQIKKLLSALPETGSLKQIRIIGIEPFSDALKRTEFSLRQEFDHLPFRTEFIGICKFIEDLEASEISKIIDNHPNLIINASLALHHIQTLEKRNQVIRNLRQLNPIAFFLTEPNVDHFEPDFYRRFQNCYRHFHHIFQVIDLLNIETIDKNGLKLFFGREIEDIIGKNNIDRFEKHEPAFRWIEKLKHNGFSVNNSLFTELPNIYGGVRMILDQEGYLGFSYETETILLIICAQPLN